jgi:hypothetical protein
VVERRRPGSGAAKPFVERRDVEQRTREHA